MLFSIKEAFRLIRRAKASFILSLISLSISVILITASIVLIELSDYYQNKIKEEITINLFLNNDLSLDNINGIKTDLQNRVYVKSVSFISKDKAAEIFIKETGEDFRKLLNYNPLPASFSITLKENYFEKDSLKRIVNSLSEIKGIDDLSFKDDYVYKLISILDTLKRYIFVATIIILLISIYIVYSTVRLIVSSRLDELETMKLVGARLFTIKMPVILNSMIAGLLAGIAAAAFFILFISVFDNYISILNILGTTGYFYPILIICIGPFLSLLISILSLRNVTLKI